ncbi:hypothetical protein PWP93_26475 [Paraburkholderia sp. A1RI-2L]|uniref:hypothetical protein n=1 Tax=Paraburkholderia sp. A1RI-2L TaxID=3028367 RepID=UPI003B7859A5
MTGRDRPAVRRIRFHDKPFGQFPVATDIGLSVGNAFSANAAQVKFNGSTPKFSGPLSQLE